MQSLYTTRTISEVTELVRTQPSSPVFFKVFLELGMKPLVSYLAFDTNSMEILLNEKNWQAVGQGHAFNKIYPIFYKNKDGRSAIDNAIQFKQIRSVELMIDYLVKF